MPYMPRFVVWLIILCVVLLILAHLAHSAEDDGWSLLLRNDPVHAEEQFKRELATAGQNPDNLEGLYQALLLQGKTVEAYEILQQAAAAASGSPLQGLFLLRLGTVADFAGKIAAYNSFSETVYNDEKTDAYTRTVAGLIMNNICLQHNDFTGAEAALDRSTRIKQVSRVLGPVYIPQKYGVNLSTPVEENLLAPDYFSRDNVIADAGGRIELGSILPSDGRSGVAYIYVTLNSPAAMQAVLDLYTGAICRVWINGEPVYSSALFKDGFIGARNSRVVRLQEGKNLLLFKAFRNDVLQIGLRNAVDGGKLEGVRVLPYAREDWEGARLQQYGGRVFSEEYAPPFLALLEENTGWAAVFWRNFYYEYTRNYGKGIEQNEELLHKYPQSALINYAVGEYYQGYANYFESKQRAVSMCEKYMREAIRLKPDYLQPELVLAKIYLASQQDFSALKLLKKIEEKNKNIPWVYRALAEQYLKEGWLAPAAEAITAFYKLSPQSVAEVISFYLDMNEYARAQELLTETADKLPLYSRYKLLLRLNKIKAAQEAIEEWYKHYPLATDKYLAALIEIARLQGDYVKVGEYLAESLRQNPDSAALLLAIGENKIRQGEMQQGTDWLRKAHAASVEYKPSMPELLRRIEVNSSGRFELAGFDIDLKDIDYGKVMKEDFPRASFANLLNLRVVRIFADLSSETYEHRAFKVFGNEGIEQLAELNIGQGEIIQCRTIAPDGVEFIPESGENVSFDKAISMYNVGIGSVLEYSKRLSGNAVPFFHDRFEFESFNNPVIRSKYVLILPVALLARLNVEGNEPQVRMQGDDAVLIWEDGLHAGIEPEEYMPLVEDVLDSVNIGVYSKELNAPELIAQDKPVLATQELDNTARDLCRGLQTTREKVEAVYRWIAGNIQKNADGVSARDAYIMRAGTAESKLKLLQAMLQAVGVTSYPLLSNIPFSIAGRLTREDRVDSMAEFTLPLLLRIENEDPLQPDIWVRITDDMKDSRVADIGTLNQGALALEYSPLGTRFSAVRDNDLEGVRVISPRYLLLSDGSAEVQGGVEFFGSSAVAPRKVFYNSTHAQQYAAQIANQLFPGIIEANYSYPSAVELEQSSGAWYQPLLLNCSGRILNYCVRRGADLYFAPFSEGNFVKNLIVKQPRIRPVLIQMDIQNSQSRSYTIPEGYVYVNVPMDRVISSSFGVFILDYNIDGRKLVVSGSLLIPAQEIAPEDSELYNSFLSEVKEAAGRGIILRQLADSFGEEVVDEGVVAPVTDGRFVIRHVPENLRKLRVTEGN